MNAHQRKVANRKWRIDHATEIRDLLSRISGPPAFEVTSGVKNGICDARKKRFLGFDGQMKTASQWKQFLSRKGVTDFA